jgi:peptidoglycan/xylan/chitin deacetylase (PgdA/CDA1 family)
VDKNEEWLAPNSNLSVSYEFLEKWVEESMRLGYRFVSMDEVAMYIGRKTVPRKIVALTFDDGYLDNAKAVIKLAETLSVPSCIYVSSHLIQSETWPWWFSLDKSLQRQKEIWDPLRRLRVNIEKSEDKENWFLKIRTEVIRTPHVDPQETILSFVPNYESRDALTTGQNPMLLWRDVRNLSKNPAITIGSHGHKHVSLGGLSIPRLIDNIRNSICLIESQVGFQPKHFAFPFGGRSEAGVREFSAVSAFNFSTAVTTQSGRLRTNTNPFSIPRLELLSTSSMRTHRSSVKEVVKNAMGIDSLNRIFT